MTEHTTPPLCPSAQPEMEGARIFGVVEGTARAPRVRYVSEPLPVTPQLLALTEPVPATEVFRIAAPCAATACQHFDGVHCTLAQRVVQMLPLATDVIPPCQIRSECRWWRQEGSAACRRCPQVVTQLQHPTELQAQAAGVKA